MLPNLHNKNSMLILVVPSIIIVSFTEIKSLDSCIEIGGFPNLTPIFP